VGIPFAWPVKAFLLNEPGILTSKFVESSGSFARNDGLGIHWMKALPVGPAIAPPSLMTFPMYRVLVGSKFTSSILSTVCPFVSSIVITNLPETSPSASPAEKMLRVTWYSSVQVPAVFATIHPTIDAK